MFFFSKRIQGEFPDPKHTYRSEPLFLECNEYIHLLYEFSTFALRLLCLNIFIHWMAFVHIYNLGLEMKSKFLGTLL